MNALRRSIVMTHTHTRAHTQSVRVCVFTAFAMLVFFLLCPSYWRCCGCCLMTPFFSLYLFLCRRFIFVWFFNCILYLFVCCMPHFNFFSICRWSIVLLILFVNVIFILHQCPKNFHRPARGKRNAAAMETTHMEFEHWIVSFDSLSLFFFFFDFLSIARSRRGLICTSVPLYFLFILLAGPCHCRSLITHTNRNIRIDGSLKRRQ